MKGVIAGTTRPASQHGNASHSLSPPSKMNHITFKLPGLPPSKNNLRKLDLSGRRKFQSGKSQYILQSDEARQWSNRIWPVIPAFSIGEKSYLHLEMEFHYPFFYANGRLRIFDSANLQEALQDVICKRIGVNDARIKSWVGESVDDDEEFVLVKLSEVEVGQVPEVS